MTDRQARLEAIVELLNQALNESYLIDADVADTEGLLIDAQARLNDLIEELQ